MRLLFIFISGLLAALATIQSLLSWRDRRRFRPPGVMNRGLHMLKMGEGEGLPPVIFESGIANSCLSWSVVQPELARQASTYSYDRAGLGWSSALRGSCSLERMTQDLRALLDCFNVNQPVILVAHSFGAYIARFYTHRFPAEVGGLVLVDPATPEEWMHPSPQQRRRLRRAVFFTRAAGVLACFGVVRFGLWMLLLRKQETPGPLSRFSRTLQRIRFELRKVRPDVLPQIRAHWSRPGFFWTMAAYLQALPDCAGMVSTCSIPENIPVTVLSGSHQSPERMAEHAAIATRHMIAGHSAHFIYLDEPELVVSAVMEILQRQGSPARDRRSRL